jgi:uncharacterized DUF497 family protein
VFEFDEQKSKANKAKHGIDFHAAQRLWADPDRLEIGARLEDEARWIVIGRIAGRIWAAVITDRSGVVRLISVRRAREKEVALYESQGV